MSLTSCRQPFKPLPRNLVCWWGLLLGLVLVLPVQAQYPNQPQGFDAERSYHGTAAMPDQVDLFSGRLSVAIPIGPFALTYNNNVWRYQTVIEDKQEKVLAQPDRLQNAGLGWHLGLGELYPPGHWYNSSVAGQWIYVGENGTRHTFYSALHRNENDGDLDVFYTRDNSYLRLRKIVSGSIWDIEFPDGTTRRFVRSGTGVSRYRVTKIWDAFTSAADPNLTITYSADGRDVTVADRFGREHRIELAGGSDLVDGYPLSWMDRVVTRVDLQGVAGQRSVYEFDYANILVSVSCKNTSGAIGTRIRLPHLVGLTAPDGTKYRMEQGGVPSYINTCPPGIDDAPGSLERLELPSGGVMTWTYQEFEFPPGHNWGPFNTSAGVATRTARNADGSVLGSWNYVTRDFGGSSTVDPDVRTDVVALPEGDCTRHFFSALDYVQPSQGKGWEYGLPFVRLQEVEGRYLSSEVYDDHNSSMLCTGNKLRTTYLRFRHDPLPGAATNPQDPSCQSSSPCSRTDEWYNTNRTPDAMRVVFHDDGNRWVDTEYSEFDGVGNFRKSVTRGNLWGGSLHQERRETVTEYNRSPGTFPGGGYVHPSPSEPWLLSTFSSVEIQELDAHGESLSRVITEFDDTTGAMECLRRLSRGANWRSDDIVVTFDHNSRGLVTDIKTWGSDQAPLLTTKVNGCGALPSEPDSWQHHEYDYEVLARTRPFHPNGVAAPFLTHDVTVDPASGAILASRDTAGFETQYAYDALGRVTEAIPEQGARVRTTYIPAAANTGASIHVQTLTEAATARGVGEVFAEQEQILDSFGRIARQRHRKPGGDWGERRFTYNARGWLLTASEWNSPTLLTRYLGHDPFGRPATVRPPEGSSHDVDYLYQGVRSVHRTSRVLKAIGAAESPVVRTQEFDRYGRLRTVLEPLDGGASVQTTYLYDVGNRLTRIVSGLGSSQQVRSYDYDNRGFLLAETLPEKGVSGNGSVFYSGYDTRGNVGRKLDNLHDVGYQYDGLGRLIEVQDRNDNSRTLRSFTYDGAGGRGLGKLERADAFNRLPLPNGGSPFDVHVTQYYTYLGVGGAVSTKETRFDTPTGVYRMRTEFERDDAGKITAIDYPRCISTSCSATALASAPRVDFERTYGRVTQVPGFANSITYHAAGMPWQIQHANGVTTTRLLDTQHRDRLRRIYTSGAGSFNWDSGTMQYDGSGNLTHRGVERFSYDTMSRLTEARLWFGVTSEYDYDIFGNLKAKSGSPAPGESFTVDSATNRVNVATYDSAGNVVNWQGQPRAFDPLGQVINQRFMIYAYDAHGERAASFATDSSRPIFHLRGLDQELLSTLSHDGQSTYLREKEFVYANGRPLAVMDFGTVRHYHLDHLGSLAMRTEHPGGQAGSVAALLPYGERVDGLVSDTRVFTGHERDFSANSDYMHNRHYSSGFGRFLSVDTYRGNPAIPQSLNRYTYALGNPLKYWDPDGREEQVGDVEIHDWIDVIADAPVFPTIPPINLDDYDIQNGDYPWDRRGPLDEGPAGPAGVGDGDDTVTPQEEQPEEEDEGCDFKIDLAIKLAAKAALLKGGSVSWTGGLFSPTSSVTALWGDGLAVPGAHAGGGVKLGQGTVSGFGHGFVVSGGKGLGGVLSVTRNDSGAWSATLTGGGTTPQAGLVYGRTYTWATTMPDGAAPEQTECN